MPDSGASYVTVTIDPDPGLALALDTLSATEELGRPFLFQLDLSSGTAKGDLTSMLGSSATLSITLPEGGQRYFNGIVARAAYSGLVGGQYHYRLELRPWIWLLSRKRDCRIFQNQSAWNIITQIFRDAGFSGFEDKRQNQAGDLELEYCVQYDETSLDFVTRLMERFGIYYYFSHADGSHTMILADDPASHTALPDSIPYRFRERDVRALQAYVWDWSTDLSLQSGAVTLNDYNFTTPSADLTSTSRQPRAHPHSGFEVYEYPGPHGVSADGEKLANVRMQNYSARGEIVSGTGNARALVCGCKFTLGDEPGAEKDREYLVIAATCTVQMAEGLSDTGGGMIDTFRCAFSAIPGDRPFRLDPRTVWPVMRGPQTAKVVGASGDEITTDQYGRIKVKFPWDRIGPNDNTASCWIRVAQVWAGAGWGGIVIPRVGQEVVIDYLDGDPDRPLVTGCVYNATQTVPYGLPDNKTRSTFKTNSSTGGSGFNEFRFEDKAGSEEVFFQAQKDYNKVVLNNETVKVTQDTTTTVAQGNRSVTVSQGNDGLTVTTGNHSIEISAGSSSLTAGQSITLKANTQITLQVGGTSITLSASGITLSAPQISATAEGTMSLDGGGSMTLTAGAIAIN